MSTPNTFLYTYSLPNARVGFTSDPLSQTSAEFIEADAWINTVNY